MNFDKDYSITVGTDTFTIPLGFWDFSMLEEKLKEKDIVLKKISHNSKCSVFHETKDLDLKDLGPFLGFPANKTISLNTETVSPKSVNLLKGLSYINIKGDFVNRNYNMYQGSFSNIMCKIPLDTTQILNGNVTRYQPWSSTPVYENSTGTLTFYVNDNSSLTNPTDYSLFVEMEFV